MIARTAAWVQMLLFSARPGQTGSLFKSIHPTTTYLVIANRSASCPYLTNVGATKVYPGKTVFDPESAVVDPPGQPYRIAFSSGGGFSNIYSIPDYQANAVAS